jgi:hypothetical protein
VKIVNLPVLDTIISLLGDVPELRGALETKSVLAPNRMMSHIVSLPKGEAIENRDALAKVCCCCCCCCLLLLFSLVFFSFFFLLFSGF